MKPPNIRPLRFSRKGQTGGGWGRGGGPFGARGLGVRSIQLDDWRMICKMGQRGAVLEVAAVFGWEGVGVLLDGLRRAYAMTEDPPC